MIPSFSVEVLRICTAIRASQLGKKVAIVERQLLGGTCLHKGCIPTKSLLKSAEVFQTVKQAAMFGVDVKDANVNFENMLAQKKTLLIKCIKV